MGRTTDPHSTTSKLVEIIRPSGSERTADLAEATGLEPKFITALLTPRVKTGNLVACKIEVPGKAAQNEYRIGSGLPLKGSDRPALSTARTHHPHGPQPEVGDNTGSARSEPCDGSPDEASAVPLTLPAPASSVDGAGTERFVSEDPLPLCAIDSTGRMSISIGDTTHVLRRDQVKAIWNFMQHSYGVWHS